MLGKFGSHMILQVTTFVKKKKKIIFQTMAILGHLEGGSV